MSTIKRSESRTACGRSNNRDASFYSTLALVGTVRGHSSEHSLGHKAANFDRHENLTGNRGGYPGAAIDILELDQCTHERCGGRIRDAGWMQLVSWLQARGPLRPKTMLTGQGTCAKGALVGVRAWSGARERDAREPVHVPTRHARDIADFSRSRTRWATIMTDHLLDRLQSAAEWHRQRIAEETHACRHRNAVRPFRTNSWGRENA
jgi:hypothetical protein